MFADNGAPLASTRSGAKQAACSYQQSILLSVFPRQNILSLEDTLTGNQLYTRGSGEIEAVYMNLDCW